jgi:hypothetical protein
VSLNTLLLQERFLLRRKPENGTLTAAQTSTTTPAPGTEGSNLWWVPITYTSLENPDFNNTRPSFWLKATPALTLPHLSASADHWVIFNIQETGCLFVITFHLR